MIAWLIPLVGERAAKPVFFAILILLIFAAGFTISRCGNTGTQRQATQTTRSGDAIANAASSAVQTISNRAVTESDIDNATATTTENIDHAQNPVDVRNAVLAGVCAQGSHSHDPACAMR